MPEFGVSSEVIALVLALLSPLVLGSAQKVERLFEAAEALYERSDHTKAQSQNTKRH